MIDHPVALVKYAALVGCGVTHSVALVGCDVSRIPPEILNVYFYISVMMAHTGFRSYQHLAISNGFDEAVGSFQTGGM